jgi:hypothetical protein
MRSFMDAPIVLGIDPGTVQTAFALWNGQKVVECDIVPNQKMLEMLRGEHWAPIPIFVEMVASYGMPVGKEIFETVLWIGRFVETWDLRDRAWKLVYRQEVKLFHCHTSKAKDSNIAQALRDKYGEVGTKKTPGPLYGVKKDIWSALAIASFAHETFRSTQA